MLLAEEAVRLDSENADAWALLASARVSVASGSSSAADDGYTAATSAAERALQLDSDNPGALAARAKSRWLGAWETGAARSSTSSVR